MIKWWLLMGAVVSLLLCGSAGAQQSPNQLLAKKHFELGAQLYKTSNYRQALVEFSKAYQLSKKPGLQFNIARCHEVMANLEEAVKYYRMYLAQVPRAPNRALVETRLANLEKVLSERKARAKPALAPMRLPPAGPKREPVKPVEPAPVVPTLKPRPEPVVEAGPAPADTGPRKWKRTVGWIALGTGGALVVTGIVFGAMASSKTSDYEEAAKTQTYKELGDMHDEGEILQSTQIGLTVAGGVLAAVGGGLLLWHHMGRRKNDEPSTATVIAPVITDNTVGLMGRMQF